MTTPKEAIPTLYRGVQMRSRMEANVAQLLDTLGFEWSYEPQSFLLGSEHYRPDFYCPRESLWVEVRGYHSDKGERQIAEFAEMVSGVHTFGPKCSREHESEHQEANRYVVFRRDEVSIFWISDPRAGPQKASSVRVYICSACLRRSVCPQGDPFTRCFCTRYCEAIVLGEIRMVEAKPEFFWVGDSAFEAGYRVGIAAAALNVASISPDERVDNILLRFDYGPKMVAEVLRNGMKRYPSGGGC